MACCGGGGARPTGARKAKGYMVTTMEGAKIGPFLTPTEARVEAQAAGGGVIKAVYDTAPGDVT